MLKKINQFISVCSNAIASIVILIITGYQRYLSPFLGQNCRHYPSCSNYSKQSFKKYGVLKGAVLTSARLIRCNPWSLGGFDPLPEEVKFKEPHTFKICGNYQSQLYNSNE